MATTEQELNELRKQVEAERQEASGLDPEKLEAYWGSRRDVEAEELRREQAHLAEANASNQDVTAGGEEKTETTEDVKSLLANAKQAMTGGAVSGGSDTGTTTQTPAPSEQTAPDNGDDYDDFGGE